MEKLIQDVYDIIKDYRKEEGCGVSKQRIKSWINQFAEEDRTFVLSELKYIFEKVYFSRENTLRFLKIVVKELVKKFKYSHPKDFLDNANFLDLQDEGKSQKVLLQLLQEVLKTDFSYDYINVGSESSKHCVYIDDVLCTGNTFRRNIEEWLLGEGQNRFQQLQKKEINLTVMYMAMANEYYHKKIKSLSHRLEKKNIGMLWKEHAIKGLRFKEQLLKPTKDNPPQLVTDYEAQVIQEADDYAAGKYSYESDFYREKYTSETFYSSAENRKRLEAIFLQKGIEILNNSNVSKFNVRPLGYSLPSYKDFGFGMLFFSWRNVPNNTPLVFWYISRDFMPLFENKR